MANICNTDFYIKNNDKKAIKTLFDFMANSLYKNFGQYHQNALCNLLMDIDADGTEKALTKPHRCTIEYMDMDDDTITITADSAWEPLLETWIYIIHKLSQKFSTDYEITYYAEEPGCSLFWTNDEDYEDKYRVDTWYSDDSNDAMFNHITKEHFGESPIDVSELQIISYLQDVFSTKDDVINSLLYRWHNSEYSSYASINKWEIVKLENWS